MDFFAGVKQEEMKNWDFLYSMDDRLSNMVNYNLEIW